MNYLDLIEKNQDEMIRTLQELISIKSVISAREGDAPFGAGIQEAFEYMLKRGTEEGFQAVNIDNYGGHIEFAGRPSGPKAAASEADRDIMAIAVHLDVVPEGTGWGFPPYGGELSEGRIYGRGSIDDKGPAVAAFYAMKALKDSGFVPEKRVRLILGLDEETNWKGMEYYLQKAEMPSFGFTPDCNFPAVYAEKGVLTFDLVKKIGKTHSKAKGAVIDSLVGGNAPNSVADIAKIVLIADSYQKTIDKLCEFKKETGYSIDARLNGIYLEITVHGVSSHGARPAEGLNAISILMKFLSHVELANDEIGCFVDFYNTYIGFELDGTSLGCGFTDEPSGKLILNVGMIKLDKGKLTLTVNIRYPVTFDDEKVYGGMTPALRKYGIELVGRKHQKPIYLSKEDKMVAALIDIYRKHTGDTDSEPMVTGCTTYARAIRNSIAFGAVFPGEPELGHQKNEYITVKNLMLLAKIFAEAIYVLAGPEA
ncbi:MAG TPA: dipeptidase PepV [Anaerovoracaceae bacterium]|nr:dipeptidase PepV [Anaerovoracaceae bacterium]